MLSILTVAMLSVAQPAIAPKPLQAPPVAIERITLPKAKTYADYRAEAIAAGLPIVIFVRCESRPVAGAVVCRVDHLDGYDSGPNIVIGVPDAKVGMRYKTTLPADATDTQIRREIGVTQSRLPFFKALRDRRIADAEIPASGRWYTESETAKVKEMWPKGLPVPEGIKFYWQTKLSQRIAVTDNRASNAWYHEDRDDVFTNAPTSFNPNKHDPRWAAPGGLLGVSDWESYTAATFPDQLRVWKQPVPIANGGIIDGAILWEYPPGTTFADLLVSKGKPFELRYREKKADGQWDSYVAWKDVQARPDGYFGAGQKCSTCHNLAGASEQYGITVRGKDTVFSFLPFDL